MKIYDKDIYRKQEGMKKTIIIIVVFLIGFIAGYFASTLGIVGNSTNTLTNDIETNIVQSVSLK